jgi:nucleoside-triphosphatase
LIFLRERVLLLTGNPGVGKTTLFLKVVDELERLGFSVGGMVSREVREAGFRVGFVVCDLTGGTKGWLAHVNHMDGPKVGKYTVNLQDLEGVGVKAIFDATKDCQVVAIDEIGPMELHSKKFLEAVLQAISSDKTVIAVIHQKTRHHLVTEIKSRPDAKIFTVTEENRNILAQAIINHIVKIGIEAI